MHPHIQKNLDTFKKTFTKPSRIYRFLCESWKSNPLYLNRTLSYVSKHRDHRIRKRDTKIDSIAKRLSKTAQAKPTKVSKLQQQNDTLGNDCDTSNTINENKNHSLAYAVSQVNNNNKIVSCYFNWICDDAARTSQKTKSYGFMCPWCSIDCSYLDTLMMHLKCCHSRFNFNLVEEDGHSVIEMTLNKSFDGSYCGFKYPGHDLRRDFRFTPFLPERRNPTTQVIYFNSRRCTTNFNSFVNPTSNANRFFSYTDDDEADIDVCSGRLYYHTSTCLPIKPNECDIDSEADMDPDWLRERTQLMIDEFTDVNEGEKEILKLWNLHIMKNYKYKGDNMIRQACLDFVESEGNTIMAKNLIKNFTLHLANLFDFGLIGSGDLLECIRMLRKLKTPVSNGPTKQQIAIRPKLERNSNEHCQHSPPAKRALLNSYCNK